MDPRRQPPELGEQRVQLNRSNGAVFAPGLAGDETMPRDESGCSNLCYVASRQLNAPLMDRLDVWTTEGRRIGAFEGVVMDADEQRARYLVVDCGRFRPNRCLIPLPAQLDVVHQTLRVDADDLDLDHLQRFDARAFPAYRSVSRN